MKLYRNVPREKCANLSHSPTTYIFVRNCVIILVGQMYHSVPHVPHRKEIQMEIRNYQQECIDILESKPSGRYLVQMATGLGKTVTFANLPRHGNVLLLSHREELVRQPLKYYSCKTGVEMANNCSSPDDEVVSASVHSIVHRLEKFDPYRFHTIIVDEAHHAAAKTYRKVLEHFKPEKIIGFTATPNRSDKAKLCDIFDEIVFQRNLLWGIKNGYLCDIFCRLIDIGYDLSQVQTRQGDYAPGELAQAMAGTEDAIAEAYHRYAKGATLIFAASVEHAQRIAEKIPGAVVVTGKTKNRSDIIRRFTKREIPCIVNCMVFTEGTDMPLVETVIVARPTQSDSLYAQMVGRGLRLHPEKEKLTLIDCVGVTGKKHLCTAPTLLGIDMASIPEKKQQEVEGMLFELPMKAEHASDCVQSWIRNSEIVSLWAKQQQIDMRDINFFRMPDGSLICSLEKRKSLRIPCQDELGNTTYGGQYMPMQQAIDLVYRELLECYADQRYIWDLSAVKRWGSNPASDAQKKLIRRRCRKEEIDYERLTKFQASQILNRIMGGMTS